MGMYDVFLPLGAMRELFFSPEGNPVEGLQTKSFGCELTSYFLYERRLYKFDRRRQNKVLRELVEINEAGQLVMTQTDNEVALPMTEFSGVAVVYSHDTRCLPVLYVEPEAPRPKAITTGDKIRSEHPWCEWAVTIEQGTLMHAVAVEGQMQSRAELRAAMQARGLKTLPDTDPIAQERFARFRAGQQAARK